MAENLTCDEFQLFRSLIEELSGISLGQEKAYLVETRLAGLVAEHRCRDYGSLYRLASGGQAPGLRERLVDAMTTNETLWFRDGHPFTILREKLLPKLAEDLARSGRYRIRIWSGACSTGQEPYSIAMSVLEFCRSNPVVRPEQFEIVATDLSPTVLRHAQAGRYDQASLGRGLPPEFRDRYLHRDGDAWAVNDEVRRLVTFRRFNLRDPLEPLGHFDIVFLRYVTIYFAEAFKQRIYRGIARLLAPDGHLIISAVESLRGLAEDYAQLRHGGGSYYQCRLR